MKELIIILLLILVIYLSFINTKPKHHKKHHKKHHIPKHAVMPHCWFDKENPCHFNDTIIIIPILKNIRNLIYNHNLV